MTNINLPIPSWIWHPDREKRLKTKLHYRFRIGSDIKNPVFGIALTGSAKVLIDGTEILDMLEDPENVYRFSYGRCMPLKRGEHTIEIQIECQNPMPKHGAISFAYDRTVGCIAWLESDNFRIVTSDKWSADDDKAIEICKLGQEPYGDLDNAPPDFIRSGFDDLISIPLSYDIMEANNILFRQQDEMLKVSGNIISGTMIEALKHQEFIPIYHLRKQEDWKKLRMIQRKMDMTIIPNILLDLKRENNVRLRAKNLGSEPVKILWNGAESLFELANYDGCITEILELGIGECFSVPTGLRYLALFILGKPGAKFEIELMFESVLSKIEQIGTFWCDDDQINRIYETSVHTNRICNQLALWDGIKRDRLPWVYDLYLAARGAYPLWNDFTIVKRSLMEMGSTPYGEWMNSLPSYTLWWFVTVWEYIMHRSDIDFVSEIAPYIQRHVDWVSSNVDEKGFLKVDSSFIDWVPISKEESLLALQAIYVIAKHSLVNISEVFDLKQEAINWRIADIPEERFLDSEAAITKVLGILSGYISYDNALSFLRSYQLTDPISPCSAYLLACLYADFDMPDKGLSIIKTLWGGMLDRGATTFWEAIKCDYPEKDFHKHLTTYTAYGSYRMSLCHAWSSTPVEWFTRVFLGVNPVEPGYRKVEIAIWAPDNMNQCEGTVPTPFGNIHVSWVRKDNGKIIVKTNVPSGIEIV